MKRGLLFALPALVAAACSGKYVRPTTEEKIEGTPERIARGNYLVNSITMCGACHTPRIGGNWLGGERTDAFLGGGSRFDDRTAGYKVAVPNISQDHETGIGAWSDDEILRAIRDGVGRDGSLLRPPMPFASYRHLSDEDVRSIVAFLRTVPAVRNKVDRSQDSYPFGMRMAIKMGAAHHEPAKNVISPPPSDKKAYGAHLARVGVCFDCHSLTSRGPSEDADKAFAGSQVPLDEPEYGKVWARNLTPDPETGLGKYSDEQIKQSLRSGKRLDGKTMAPPMSLVIPHLSTWAEEDLDALIVFLRALPPIKHAVPERQLTAEARQLVGE